MPRIVDHDAQREAFLAGCLPLFAEGGWETRVANEAAPEELPDMEWLDLTRDADLVWRAREAAHRLAAADPRLRSGWATEVARTLKSRWTRLFGEEGPSLDLEARSDGASSGGGQSGRLRRRR